MIHTIKGKSINDTWFQAMRACMEHGRIYRIDKGEFEGIHRKEIIANIIIEKPWIRPLAASSRFIVPTTNDKILSYYYNYLINPNFDTEEEEKNNEYKYATWIIPGWPEFCKNLAKDSGGTNQSCITLGEAPGQHFEHKPCLRVIQGKIIDETLEFFLYWRSWDCAFGLPENLGGIELLKEETLDYINMVRNETSRPLVKNGKITAFTPGLHIYEHSWEVINNYVNATK